MEKNIKDPLNKIKTYSLYFGDKDKDLWQWAAAIPKGRFSIIIKDMLRAYENKEPDYKIPTYKSSNLCVKPFKKNFIVGKADYDIFILLKNFDNRLLSYEIKNIIRFYLNDLNNKTLQLNRIDNFNRLDKNNIKDIKPSEENVNFLNTLKNKKSRR